MPTFKELKAQGLSDQYPIITRNDQEELIATYQKINWSGDFLDATIEYRELPAPTFLTLATSGETTLGMSFSPHNTGKQDLVVPFPPAPEKDEHGKYPPRPDNLPPRPVRDNSDHVIEKRFGRLVPIKRPLNDDEQIWRNHDYLQRYTRWKCWASRVPIEWCLLEPAEYAAYDSLNPDVESSSVTTTTVQETYLGTFFLLLLSIGMLFAKVSTPLAAVAYFIIVYTLLLPTFRIHQNLAKEIFSSILAAVSTPVTTLGVMLCWVTGTMGLATATLVAVLETKVLDSFASLNRQVRQRDSTLWRAIYNTQLAITGLRDGLLSEAMSSAYEARFTLILKSVLCSGSIYLMLEEPSTVWLCTCTGVCLVMAICILAAFMGSEDQILTRNPVIIPVAPPAATSALRAATTMSGRSGVAFADPLATPLSFDKSSLLQVPRPRELVHDFGTPTRGPLSKAFGARRSPPDLFEPSFFTTPPARIFT